MLLFLVSVGQTPLASVTQPEFHCTAPAVRFQCMFGSIGSGRSDESDGLHPGNPVERVQAMRWIVVVAALVALPGCGWSSDTEKWRRTAEDYKTQLETANTTLEQTQKDFKEQSEKWQNQTQKLSAAMMDASTTVDPFEIRKIYQDNRDLAAVADQLEAKIKAAVPENGALMLSDAQLRFDVTGFKGRSVIRAYLDYDTAPFLEAELAVPEPVLPLSYNIATGFYDELFKADRANSSESASSFFRLGEHANDEMTAKLADTHFSARRSEIDTRYKDAVTSEFSAYLKRGGFGTPQGLPKPVFLAHQFGTPGRHEIRVRLEPKTPDWEVRLTATDVAKAKDEKVIKYWQLNANTTPMPNNIPNMVFWIRYRPEDRK